MNDSSSVYKGSRHSLKRVYDALSVANDAGTRPGKSSGKAAGYFSILICVEEVED